MVNEEKEDRHEILVSIREHPKYRDTYIVDEKDPVKGMRTCQINSQFDANIKTDKYDPREVLRR